MLGHEYCNVTIMTFKNDQTDKLIDKLCSFGFITEGEKKNLTFKEITEKMDDIAPFGCEFMLVDDNGNTAAGFYPVKK